MTIIIPSVQAQEIPLLGRSGPMEGVSLTSANITEHEQAHEDGTAAGIRFRTLSNDPRLVFAHAPVEAAGTRSLRIRFSKSPARPGESLEFYFITREDRRWTEKKGAKVPIPARAGAVELTVDLHSLPAWSGGVIGTRLDFGQISGAEVTVSEVSYSDKPPPPPVSGAADPIARRIERFRVNPSWTGTAEEARVLNSEYLVLAGRETPLVLPLTAAERASAGVAPEHLAFDVRWSAAGAGEPVRGGWNSELWWLRDLERVTLRYRVRQTQGKPAMVWRLYEREAGVGLNNDAWSRSVALGEVKADVWHELVLDRDSMRFAPAGEGTPQWDLINYLTVEFQGRGHDGVELWLEGPVLHLRDGRKLPVWDPIRRLAQFEGPEASRKIAAGAGRFLIGKGGSVLGGEAGRATLLDLKRVIPNLGLAANQGMRYVAEHADWLRAHDIGVVYQQGGAYGLAELISAGDGWLANPAGVSRATAPGSFGMVGLMKYYDMTAPAVRSGFAEASGRLGQAGVGEFQIIESYWPWVGGFWGWGEGTLRRLRQTLAGEDEGLTWRTPAGETRLGFRDYFRLHNGFFPEPGDVGLASWAEFSPPRLAGVRAAKTNEERRHFFLMMNLTRYEALKFYAGLGRSAAPQGVRLGTVINRENYDNSFDLLGLVAQPGVGTVGHEYFGNPRHYLDHAFDHGGVMRALMDASGTGLRAVVESNATGTTGRPYYDPQIAYATALAAWAADRPHSAENDWLSWYLSELGKSGSPRGTVERERYADFVLKGMAFDHACGDGGWTMVAAEKSIGVLRTRTINDIGAPTGAWLSLLGEEAWPRQTFDFSEARFLGDRLATGSVLVGEWSHCTDDDVAWLESWLDAAPLRTLVLMGYRPGKKPDGTNYVAAETPAYSRINTQDGFRRLLGAEARRLEETLAGRVEVKDWLETRVQPGMEFALSSYYEARAGTAVATVAGRAIVSETRRANGSRVVYLHYDPDAATRGLDRAILYALAAEAGIEREVASSDGLVLRRFSNAAGSTMIAAFDLDWMRAFRFVYDPLANLRMSWAWNGPARRVKLDRFSAVEANAAGAVYVVDRLRGGVTEIPSAKDVTLSLDGVGCGVWLITRERAEADRAARQAEAIRPYLDYTFSILPVPPEKDVK